LRFKIKSATGAGKGRECTEKWTGAGGISKVSRMGEKGAIVSEHSVEKSKKRKEKWGGKIA